MKTHMLVKFSLKMLCGVEREKGHSATIFPPNVTCPDCREKLDYWRSGDRDYD